jgi:hypothetical protein
MDIMVIGLWLAVVAIVGLIFAKSVRSHMKRSAQDERRRRRQADLIIVADPDNKGGSK